MSIICNTNQFALISHEQFVNELFKNVSNGTEIKTKAYEIKKELFGIVKPYKIREDVKKKKGSNTSVVHEKYQTFLLEVRNVEELFLQFQVEYLNNIKAYKLKAEELHLNSTNLEAIKMSNEVYTKSDNNILMNTVGGNKDANAIFVNINNAHYLIPNNCTFYSYNVSDMSKLLTDSTYDLILLDPPWWNKFIRRKRFKTGHGYNMLYNAELKELPIEKLIKANGLVVVWCTNSPQHYLYLTKEIFPKWNVKYIGKWYWVKVTKSLEPICSFSDPPGKQPFEQIIFASTQESPVVVNEKLIVSVPSAIHSHKPPLCELLKPFLPEDNAKCLEIFARYLLPNWTSYGLEAIKLQHESLFVQVD